MSDVKLLSGGNPQIAKGYGDAVVQSYIAAVPDWKQGVAAKVDALVTAAMPDVQKAVKWNSPLYGVGEELWFLSYHCATNYLKVAFHQGAQLTPEPPVASKQAQVRYFHIHEGDVIDEAQFTDWVRQASALGGVKM